jgi:hypothetical protein
MCGNYWCTIHGQHAHDCPCPGIEEWEADGIDPYSESVALDGVPGMP